MKSMWLVVHPCKLRSYLYIASAFPKGHKNNLLVDIYTYKYHLFWEYIKTIDQYSKSDIHTNPIKNSLK